MTEQTAVRFDIKTSPQLVGYEDMLRVWQQADEQPEIDGAWLFDHFMPLGQDQTGPIFEGWTLLSAYAAQTKRLRVGIMVTGNTYRHPAVLANMGATVDIVSGGRLDFGIGAGWFELEHRALGIPFPSTGERIRRLGEACEVIRLLWTEKAPDFHGRYYHLEHAYCEPKPVQEPYPPFVIGGSGEQLTLRIVAQYANVWNFAGGDVATFQHKNEVLDRHCEDVGRDRLDIVRSVQLRLDDSNLAAAREAAQAYIDAGAGHVVLILMPPYPEDIVRRVVREIIEPIRG